MIWIILGLVGTVAGAFLRSLFTIPKEHQAMCRVCRQGPFDDREMVHGFCRNCMHAG